MGLAFVFVVSPLNDFTKYLPEQQSKKEKRKKERHNRRLDPPTLRRDTAGKKWNLSMFDWYSLHGKKKKKEIMIIFLFVPITSKEEPRNLGPSL